MGSRLAYHLLLVFLSLLHVSCEDVIGVDLPSNTSKLTIDALPGYTQNDGNPIISGQVKLTLSAPFFAEEVTPAREASVRIVDEETNEVFPLEEIQPGVFGVNFPEFGLCKNYSLVVEYENETYLATQRLMPTTMIENVEQGDDFLFDVDETEVKVTFSDIPGERNYYLFSFGFGNLLVVDDEFFQDSELTFSYFYEDVFPGDLLTITLFGIDSEFANFIDLALDQSGEEGGNGPFSVPPANIKGNFMNLTNPENLPFGYFALSEFDTEILILE